VRRRGDDDGRRRVRGRIPVALEAHLVLLLVLVLVLLLGCYLDLGRPRGLRLHREDGLRHETGLCR
jgi:hypothetical protein